MNPNEKETEKKRKEIKKKPRKKQKIKVKEKIELLQETNNKNAEKKTKRRGKDLKIFFSYRTEFQQNHVNDKGEYIQIQKQNIHVKDLT